MGLPIAWALTILGGTHGAGVMSGAYYLTIGYLLANDAIQRMQHSEPVDFPVK